MPEKLVVPTRTPPRWAIYHGRKVRVVEYDGDDIKIVLQNDSVTTVSRRWLAFLKG